MLNPCHGCPDRTAGCHGHCEKYQAFVEDREKVRNARADKLSLYSPSEWLEHNIRRKLKTSRK